MQSSLTVPATLDSLIVIAQYVMTATAAAGLDQKAAYNCRLAVDEIATNIIMYGYPSFVTLGRGKVEIRVSQENKN